MKFLIAAAFMPILCLAACASVPHEPKIETVEAKVPVATSCVPFTFPAPDAYPDTDEALKAAAGLDDFVRLLTAGRGLRVARLAALEDQVRVCR